MSLEEVKTAVEGLSRSDQRALRDWLGFTLKPAPEGREYERASDRLDVAVKDLGDHVRQGVSSDELDAAIEDAAESARHSR